MNRGTLPGIARAIGDYVGGTAGQGSWGGNRGRIHQDEFRAYGNADGLLNWNVSAGSARLINTNPQARANLGEIVLPGDVGMVMNVGSGTFLLNGAPVPFAAAYNVAGKYRIGQASTNVITAAFENNTIVDNVPGVATALMGMWGVTSTTFYVANGAACTLPASPVLGDYNSAPVFETTGGGTLTGSFNNFNAGGGPSGSGVTIARRSAFNVVDVANAGVTNQYGLDVPILIGAATANTAVRIGQGGQTLSASVASPGLIDVYTGTTTLNFATTSLPNVLNIGGTVSLTQSANPFFLLTLFSITPTITNTVGHSSNFGPVVGLNYSPTFSANTQTGLAAGTSTGYLFAPNTSVSNSGTITSGTFVGMQTTGTLGTGTTVTAYTGLLCSAPTVTGTVTSWIGVDIAAMTAAGTNIGIRNASSLRQQGAFIATNNTVTVTSNAGTVPVTNYLSTLTNSSAATLTVTMTTTGAVDGQISIVRIYDATAASQTITWVNTENGEGTAPTTSNGSTTLPKTVHFQFNGSTSKWRCIIT